MKRFHSPGLAAIYGSHCEVHDFIIRNFDQLPSSYISTPLDENGKMPKYYHIHNYAFIEKTTLDQAVDLNNTLVKTPEGVPGIPTYYRVDNCYFSNPKKRQCRRRCPCRILEKELRTLPDWPQPV